MFDCYIYDTEKGWIPDDKNILMDRIIGYDATEPSDSPYGIGNTDILSCVDEITEDEANAIIAKM